MITDRQLDSTIKYRWYIEEYSIFYDILGDSGFFVLHKGMIIARKDAFIDALRVIIKERREASEGL